MSIVKYTIYFNFESFIFEVINIVVQKVQLL